MRTDLKQFAKVTLALAIIVGLLFLVNALAN